MEIGKALPRVIRERRKGQVTNIRQGQKAGDVECLPSMIRAWALIPSMA